MAESQQSADALVLTYHAIESDDSALAVDAALFREHLDRIAVAGLPVVTVSELAKRLRARAPGRAVAITFDDGFASVFEQALPLLRERNLTATIFCVGAYVGRWNDWSSDREPGRRRRLGDGEQVAEAAAAGFEIGAHGLTHAPLVTDDEELLRHELEGGRDALAGQTGVQVPVFAYPYGASSATARALVGKTYLAACTTELRPVHAADSPHALPRVDAHYLRRPELLERALDGSLGLYLDARRLGARARRAFRRDYVLSEVKAG